MLSQPLRENQKNNATCSSCNAEIPVVIVVIVKLEKINYPFPLFFLSTNETEKNRIKTT